MKRDLSILVFFGLSLFFLPINQVLASPAHEHGKISPFDNQKHSQKLHCEFNKHNTLNAYCPHINTKKNKEKPMIASDCGGKTSGTLPAFGLCNTSVLLSDIVHFNIELVLIGRKLTYNFYDPRFILPISIDHPPQTA